MSREKCESRIEQAIRLDEIVKITKDLKLSTSAVDTRGFLHQMAAFWQHLDWPVASEAYGYAVSMIENMCCCAECYVGKIFGSLNSECLQDEHGRFKASEKVAFSLSLSLSKSVQFTRYLINPLCSSVSSSTTCIMFESSYLNCLCIWSWTISMLD